MFPAKAISFDQVLPLEEQKNLAIRCGHTLTISFVCIFTLFILKLLYYEFTRGGGEENLPL